MSRENESGREQRQPADDFDDDVSTDADFGDGADVPVPGTSEPPPPPGRTDLHPGDGLTDELPDNDGERPREAGHSPDEADMPDSDLDNAEMDDSPNPR